MYILGCPYNAELNIAGLAAEWDEKRRIEAEAPKPSILLRLLKFLRKILHGKSGKTVETSI